MTPNLSPRRVVSSLQGVLLISINFIATFTSISVPCVYSLRCEQTHSSHIFPTWNLRRRDSHPPTQGLYNNDRTPSSPLFSSEKDTFFDENPNGMDHHPLDMLLHPDLNCVVDQMSPTALAYIGDSVFELFVRSRYVWPQRRTTDLQHKVVGIVRAETQSQLLSKFLEPSNTAVTLTPSELTILTRGRNAGGAGSRKRNKGPKRFFGEDGDLAGGATVYQDATALEALLGYLYIKDKNRCYQVLDWIRVQLDEADNKL